MIRKTIISLIIISYSFIFTIPPIKANEATITIGAGNGLPGEVERQVAVSLDNSGFRARGVQLEVCDDDDFISCAGCEGVDRASGFLCSTNELPDGCCKIVLLDLGGGSIAEGSGPIVTIDYDVSEEAPVGECRNLNPKEIVIVVASIETGELLSVSGEFCFNKSPAQVCIGEQIYGNHSIEAELLRYFRDNVLNQTPEGKELIRLYYQWSPVIVKAMVADKEFKEEVKELIDGILPLIREEIE